MTHYFNYDSYKLSNPDDDGHYTEDEKPRIQTAMYFKYQHRNDKRYNYGMITTSGHDVRVWNYGCIRTIDVDEIETYVEDVNGEIDRINANYQNMQFITKDEFMNEFEDARIKIKNLVHREANY
jgi:hypothetical protein